MKKDEKAEDFGAMLAEFEKSGAGRGKQRVAVGDVVRGKVISVGREAVFLTLADGKTEGVLGLEELRDEAGDIKVAVGDELEARVIELGDKGDNVVLRRLVRKGPEAKAELAQAFELGIPVEGVVSGVNKGGVDVTIAGVRAFCPISQLELRQVEDAAAYIGRKLAFRITRYEEDRRGMNMVVSRRALLEQEQKLRAVETRAKLSVGVIMPGVVTAVKDFGAFVDLGGIEGMLPASELGFVRGVKPSEVLSVGQRLEVQVMRMEKTEDPKRPDRISLSLKALSKDPWDEVAERFPPGTKVKGKVMHVESFGAFVELEPGIEGLLHVGELSGGKHVQHARELAKVGDAIEVTVLAIEQERRRISLGIGDRQDVVDAEGQAAARAAGGGAGGGKLGTMADLFKNADQKKR
jgi:small subunit ribosomal protein S1